jgi:hypothetical protein
VREWARLYQTPLWLTAVFVGLLALFAVTPDPGRTAADAGPDRTSEPRRRPGECIVCGIDQECDPASGRCVFVKVTPLPCVETARFDEKAGFCLPVGAPTPPPLVETPEPFDRNPRLRTAEPDDDGQRRRFEDDFPTPDERPRETHEPTEEPEEN